MTNILPPPIWVDQSDQLQQLIDRLLQATVIAVDTESDSLYSYYEKVCLIQFSIGQDDYLVDPLNLDVSALGVVFAEPRVQKIFHAVEFDLLSLQRDFGFELRNLFDTMAAARILGWPRHGLGPILLEHFNIKLDKKLQRYNWGQRPLSKYALNYARLDTHYLPSLRERQLTALKKQKRLAQAYDVFERATQIEFTPKIFDPDNYRKVKGVSSLPEQEQVIVRELFVTRDKIARRLDRPPFKVMNNDTLIRLAREKPSTVKALARIRGIDPRVQRQNGADILSAIKHGRQIPFVEPSKKHHRPNRYILQRYEALRHWRNQLADEKGTPPDIIMDNHALMGLAKHRPVSLPQLVQTNVLTEWQVRTYGSEIIQVMRSN